MDGKITVRRIWDVTLTVKDLRRAGGTALGSSDPPFEDPDGNTLQTMEIDWNGYLRVCAPK